MNRGKLFLWIGFGSVIAVLLSYAGHYVSLGKETGTHSQFRAITPSMGPVRDVIIVKGTVAYEHQFLLHAPVDGEIRGLEVKVGEEVARGQKLLRIESPQAAIDLSLLEIKLQKRKVQRRTAQEEVDVGNVLVKAGDMSRYELEIKMRELEDTERGVTRTELEISRMQKKAQLSYVASPVNGIVVTVPLKNGLWVSVGYGLLTVAGGEGPNVVAYIDAIDAERIHSGQTAFFSSQGDSQHRLKGRVKQVSNVVSSSQKPNSLKVVIEPLDGLQGFQIFQRLYVEIVVLEEPLALRVPRKLVYNEDGREIVYVLNEKGVTKKEIVSGAGDITYTSVISGLSLSDRLVPKSN